MRAGVIIETNLVTGAITLLTDLELPIAAYRWTVSVLKVLIAQVTASIIVHSAHIQIDALAVFKTVKGTAVRIFAGQSTIAVTVFPRLNLIIATFRGAIGILKEGAILRATAIIIHKTHGDMGADA